jgi:hypothetical protein
MSRDTTVIPPYIAYSEYFMGAKFALLLETFLIMASLISSSNSPTQRVQHRTLHRLMCGLLEENLHLHLWNVLEERSGGDGNDGVIRCFFNEQTSHETLL